ncbi:MAG: hypothetical protein R3C97_10660 [Geminicoccaceae bacterium]
MTENAITQVHSRPFAGMTAGGEQAAMDPLFAMLLAGTMNRPFDMTMNGNTAFADAAGMVDALQAPAAGQLALPGAAGDAAMQALMQELRLSADLADGAMAADRLAFDPSFPSRIRASVIRLAACAPSFSPGRRSTRPLPVPSIPLRPPIPLLSTMCCRLTSRRGPCRPARCPVGQAMRNSMRPPAALSSSIGSTTLSVLRLTIRLLTGS